MRKRIFVFSVVLTLFVGCGTQAEQTVEEKKAKVVKLFDVDKAKNFQDTRKYPALIYSFQDSEMAFEVSGKVTKFYFNEGDFVKKGAVIASLDETIYLANYNSALANYKQAQRDFKRYDILFRSNTIAKREFEQRKQALAVMKSNFEIAKKRLEETKLIAEFDGVMAKKMVKDFARITAKEPIIRLQDNSSYKVKFFVPENDILTVKEKITEANVAKLVNFFVRLEELNISIPARFIDISTTAEEVSRTFEVTLEIPAQKNLNILPGMSANVEVIRNKEQHNGVYVPYRALFSDAKKQSFLWVVDATNRVHKKAVQVQEVREDVVKVITPLEANTRVVISGVRFLQEGDEVRPYKKIGN